MPKMGAAFSHNGTKQRHKDVSIECLAIFYSNKADFLRQFITMDKT